MNTKNLENDIDILIEYYTQSLEEGDFFRTHIITQIERLQEILHKEPYIEKYIYIDTDFNKPPNVSITIFYENRMIMTSQIDSAINKIQGIFESKDDCENLIVCMKNDNELYDRLREYTTIPVKPLEIFKWS